MPPFTGCRRGGSFRHLGNLIALSGVSPEDAERQDFAPDSPRGNAICRMVDASEIAFVAVFLASDKAWAVSGELVAATGGAGRTVFY
jgi:enoyl-[acyl-carrier-protein] reductase (NADH)